MLRRHIGNYHIRRSRLHEVVYASREWVWTLVSQPSMANVVTPRSPYSHLSFGSEMVLQFH